MRTGKIPPGEAAARYAKAHQVSLAQAAERFGVSRERVRQKWRDLYGADVTPLETVREARDAQIAEFANGGLSVAEIAGQLGCAKDTVRNVRDRDDLAMVDGNEKVAIPADTKAKIIQLARAGKSRAQIVHETGVPYGSLTRCLKGHSTRGAQGPRDRSVRASEWMDQTGCTLYEAAAKFAVSPSCLWNYRKRRCLWTAR